VNQLLTLIFDKGTSFQELLAHNFFQVKVHVVNLDQHSRPDAYVKDSKPTQRMLSRLTAEWSVNPAPAQIQTTRALPAPEASSPKPGKPKVSKKPKKPPSSDSDSKGSDTE